MRSPGNSARGRWIRISFLAAALFVFLLPQPAFAQRPDQLWVELILAQNGVSPTARLVPENLQARLREVFGYRAYALLQTQGVNLNVASTQWVKPRRDFFIAITPRPRWSNRPVALDYQIYCEGSPIARGHYLAIRNRPLFVAGPNLDQGQLVFVLRPE